VTVVLGIGLGVVISAAAAHSYAEFTVSEKLSWDPTGTSEAGMYIAQLAIAVLGVLCIGSEYSSGMIRASLTAVPKRGRVLAAKSLVFAVVACVVGEFTTFAAFFAGQALISGHAPTRLSAIPGSPGRWRERRCTWPLWRCSASPPGLCSGTRQPPSPP